MDLWCILHYLLNFHAGNSLLLGSPFSSINLSIFTTPSHRSHSHSLIIISLQQYSLGTCTVLDSRVKSGRARHTWSLSFWHLQLAGGWREVPGQWQHRVVPLLGDAQGAKGPLPWTWKWGTVSGGCDVGGLRRKHAEKMWKRKRKGSPGWAREDATPMGVQNGRGVRQEPRLGRSTVRSRKTLKMSLCFSCGQGKPLKSWTLEQILGYAL